MGDDTSNNVSDEVKAPEETPKEEATITEEEASGDKEDEKPAEEASKEATEEPAEATASEEEAKDEKPTEAESAAADEKENGGKNGEKTTEGESDDKVTDSTAAEASPETKPESSCPPPIVSSTKKSRPPYKYDPDKITLRFLFANRDGLTVTVECNPGDTIGEVKGALLSVWPDDLPSCSGGDRLRLVCMGKGILMPDTRTLEDCQVPVFETHPTPINVSVKPDLDQVEVAKSGNDSSVRRTNRDTPDEAGQTTSQGCACVIL